MGHEAVRSPPMRPLLLTLIVLSWLGASVGFAAEQTVTGAISDSLCGASHANMASQVNPPLSDVDCAKACVDSGGKFVLVDGSKNVIAIANQTFAGLKEHAGQKVTLTGEIKSGAITVTKIEDAK